MENVAVTQDESAALIPVPARARQRLEFSNLKDAISHARLYGGRIAHLEGGRVFWYSPKYTMSDIMGDFCGGAEIGGWKYWRVAETH